MFVIKILAATRANLTVTSKSVPEHVKEYRCCVVPCETRNFILWSIKRCDVASRRGRRQGKRLWGWAVKVSYYRARCSWLFTSRFCCGGSTVSSKAPKVIIILIINNRPQGYFILLVYFIPRLLVHEEYVKWCRYLVVVWSSSTDVNVQLMGTVLFWEEGLRDSLAYVHFQGLWTFPKGCDSLGCLPHRNVLIHKYMYVT